MNRLQLKLSRQRQPIALRVFKQKAARRSGTSVEKRRQALDGEARHQERNGQLRFFKNSATRSANSSSRPAIDLSSMFIANFNELQASTASCRKQTGTESCCG